MKSNPSKTTKHQHSLSCQPGPKRYEDTNYTEVFAPVARMDVVRMIISLATQKNWKNFQFDVKLAFFHGELSEHVYVEQPRGYEKRAASI